MNSIAMPCVLAAALPSASASAPRSARAALRPKAATIRASRAKAGVRVVCSSDEQPSLVARIGAGMAALSLAATLQLGAVTPAMATELDVMRSPVPTGFIIDDAQLLSRATQAQVNRLAGQIEAESGYRVVVITLRKLQVETDPFVFADKVLEKWYPSAAAGNKKAVFVFVKSTKEGAVSAGPELNKKLAGVADSVVGENVPFYAEQEKFGEALTSSLERFEAVLAGRADPGPPKVAMLKTGSNFKTKEQTEDKKGVYGIVVGGLLVISFVVPMVQYYGYVNKNER